MISKLILFVNSVAQLDKVNFIISIYLNTILKAQKNYIARFFHDRLKYYLVINTEIIILATKFCKN